MINIDPDRDALARALTEGPAPDAERRADPRHPRDAVPEITSMRVSPSEWATLVNISASGLLMEGTRRFPPGVSLTVLFDGSIATRVITARVVRCQVLAITPNGTLQYQTALAFDRPLALAVDAANVREAGPSAPARE